ncbi:MAG: Uma2 family endonuclease [Bernardetiaceae bacterium]
MTAVRNYRYLSKEEYLQAEQHAEYRSEFDNGEVFAMAGGSQQHAAIQGNLIGALYNALRGTNCTVYPSDLMVEVAATQSILYPDVSVICGKPQKSDPDKSPVQNPCLIVEVLSQSSEAYDRGEKFRKYRQLDSLREYVLVAQDRICVEAFQKNDNGDWLLCPALTTPEAELELPSLGVAVSLREIYEKVIDD